MSGCRHSAVNEAPPTVRSLLIKAVMLAGTVAAALWIGWPIPPDPASVPGGSDTPPAAEQSLRSVRSGTARTSARLDLNRASIDEIQGLPGIGPVLAGRVVAWRGAHGSFGSVEQLNEVQGIGEKKLKRLRPLVTVGAMRRRLASGSDQRASGSRRRERS